MDTNTLNKLKEILIQFKKDWIKYNYNLAFLRGWKYAKDLNIFEDKYHFDRYIINLGQLGIKYKIDFF